MNINFTINGEPFRVNTSQVPISDQSLNTFIRSYANLTGTKVMCREGGCGACIVTVGRTHPQTKKYEKFAVNSCLKPVYACDGLDVTTIEGLGNRKTGYHPLQQRLDHMCGTQCGYCTPGMIMNMHGLMEQDHPLNMVTIERSFGGNMCRCTGYRPILDTFKSFARDANPALKSKCMAIGECGDIEDLVRPTSECPLTLSTLAGAVNIGDKTWHRVITLPELLDILNTVEDEFYMLVAGNTSQGITRIPDNIHLFVDITNIEEMYAVQQTADSLTIGGLVSLNDLIHAMRSSIDLDGFGYFRDLVEHFELIANVPVRNVGSIAGNLCYKHKHHEFPSDLFVSLDAANAHLTIVDKANTRTTVNMCQFLTMNMHQKVLYNVVLPRLETDAVFRSYKVMIRAQNAHAYVNAGFYIRLINDQIISARLCYGGIAPNFTHATNTEKLLMDRQLYTNETLQAALVSLNNEVNPDWILPDAQPDYRKNLALALFYRFVLSTCPADKVNVLHLSGRQTYERFLSSGNQIFKTIEKNWPLTKPVEKYEGLMQASGEAKYVNDIPRQDGELWAALVVATRVHSKIEQLDASAALAMEGVRYFFAAKDIPGSNNFTPKSVYTSHEELIFLPIGCSVMFNGQPFGVVLADSFALANRAAEKVKISYMCSSDHSTGFSMMSLARSLLNPLMGNTDKSTCPTIHNVDAQQESCRFHSSQFDKLASSRGLNATKTVRGRFEIEGQYHYTMETQCTVVIPQERELAVYSSTQWVDLTQTAIANCLSIPANHVNMVVRRVGGAYGSRITRANLIACVAALGCHLTNRPVRFSMLLEANMKIVGKRFGLIGDYVVETDDNGRIQHLSNNYSQDAGCSLNEVVDELTTILFSNCYNSDCWTVKGASVLTDAPSNTYCRAPGTLEGIAMIENIMEHIAEVTGKSPTDVRLANMKLDNPMRTMLLDFQKSIDFDNRKAACDEFNAKNRWMKRGIAVVPMQWRLDYYGVMPCLVSIYHSDGSVAVAHGGIECGQGINTKVAQVCAYALGLPLECISVKPMDNLVSANAALTGSSCTSEMSCYAVKKACDILLERIKPIRDTMKPGYTWAELIAECFAKNIDLRATFQFKDTDVASYYIYGCAAAEILVDVLTGTYQIARVDIWEDVGESMSPNVDVGQVEGAFVMGIGYWLTEELVYNRATGKLLTDRTWNYKPPGALDIPVDFRITFIQNSPNPIVGVLRSKATGEPAVCMSVVLLFALRYAIKSARKDSTGIDSEWVQLGSATTPEKVFMKCSNNFTQFTL